MDAGSATAGLLATALTAGPFTAGWVAAQRVGVRGAVAGGGGLAIVAVLLYATAVLAPSAPLWDLTLAGLCAVLGAVVGVLEPVAKRRRVLAGSALFVLVAELGTRVALPEAPQVVGRSGWQAWHDPHALRSVDLACVRAFPDSSPLRFDPEAMPPTPDGPVVLYVGDSMLVFGPTAPSGEADADQRFPERIGATDPDHRHLNLGVAATGPDLHLQIARAWLDRVDVRAIVVAFLASNDVTDLARSYPCCPGGPILGDAPALAPRCAAAAPPPDPRVAAFLRSPAPLAVQVAVARLAVAAHLQAAAAWTSGRAGPWEAVVDLAELGPTHGADVGRLDAILRAWADLHARTGIPVVFVSLPGGGEKQALEGTSSYEPRERPLAEHALATCRQAGLLCVDAWAAFDPLPHATPGLFLPDRNHLDHRGHALVADVVGPVVRDALATPPPPPSPP